MVLTPSSRSRIMYHNQALCLKQPQNNKTKSLKEMEYVKLKNYINNKNYYILLSFM
jgi:hypothetical protein